MTTKQVIVIGAGASGMMAAGRAAESGTSVLLLEKAERPEKILISGKTRCNVTNAKELDNFIDIYGSNGRFLYSVFKHYFTMYI